jgi:hypothetical protein
MQGSMDASKALFKQIAAIAGIITPMPPSPAVSTATADAVPADIGAQSSRDRYVGLIWLVSAAFFMQALDSTIVNTAVPAVASALNETPLNMRSALTSYVLTLAILIPADAYLA